METWDTDILMELADRKVHLLTQLRELSLAQATLVTEDRIDALLSLLSRKSEILDQLRAVQDRLSAFAGQTPEDRSWRSEETRQRCRDSLARCDSLIAELLAMENQSLGELTDRRDFVSQQLQQHTHAEAIHEAYRGTMEDEPASTLSLDG